jgi:hypothetical protein
MGLRKLFCLFICIFKPTLKQRDGTTKGNCDAELVLYAMHELSNYDKGVVVTGDGDFYCLIQYWLEREQLERVLVPNHKKYSALLKRFGKKQIDFMNGLRAKLEYKARPRPKGTGYLGGLAGIESAPPTQNLSRRIHPRGRAAGYSATNPDKKKRTP